MKYSSGTCGRVFYLHIEHGEDPIRTITAFVRDKGISAGFIHFIGAIKNAELVTGPTVDQLPPVPHTEPVVLAHELIGTGMIRTGEDGPAIHLHTSAGRGNQVLTGCLRGEAEAFILIEAMIIECLGMTIPMTYDPKTGMMLPDPGS